MRIPNVGNSTRQPAWHVLQIHVLDTDLQGCLALTIRINEITTPLFATINC